MEEFVSIESFMLLSKREYNALTPAERKAYDKALAMFVAAWKEQYGDEPKKVTVQVANFGNSVIPRKNAKGGITPHYAITISSDDKIIQNAIKNGNLIRPGKGCDILAQNANYPNYLTLAMTTMPYTNKGSLTMDWVLAVKGEEYETKTGKGKYTWTSFRQENLVYTASAEVNARLAQVTNNALGTVFTNQILHSAPQPATPHQTETPANGVSEEVDTPL